jgi:hypothetical protein
MLLLTCVVYLGLMAGCAYGLYGVVSAVWVFSLGDPILRIDQNGILDKRMTRDQIPWKNIKSIVPITYNRFYRRTSPRRWDAIKLDVDDAREKIESRWFYSGLERWGSAQPKDLVVDPDGLSDAAGMSRAERAAAIVTCANEYLLRSRYSGSRSPPPVAVLSDATS